MKEKPIWEDILGQPYDSEHIVSKELEEELAVKYISEAEELDTVLDKDKIELYRQWVEKHTIEVELWQGPVQPGKLNLLVAGTGVGKSTFLQNLAHHLAQEGEILYVSAEEDQGTIGLKLIDTAAALKRNFLITEERSIKIMELNPDNKNGLIDQFKQINKKQYDYIIFDYIKSNLITGDLSAHESISQIVDAFYKTVVRPNLKTVCFAAIQTNSDGNAATPEQVSKNYIKYVEGRAYAPRHASSVLFLLKDDKNSQLLVCKSRGMERKDFDIIYRYTFGGLKEPYLKFNETKVIKEETEETKALKKISTLKTKVAAKDKKKEDYGF